MKTNFAIIIAAVIFVLLSSSNTQAQQLPEPIKRKLNSKYPAWKLQSGSPRGCKSQAIITGDFDGNGVADFAVLFKQRQKGYLVVFLARGDDYVLTVLES